MEDKRGTKCARSPSKKGSPSSSDAPTPPPAPSGSPPPLGPRRRSPRVAHAHRCLSRGVPSGRLQWWIFLRLRMRNVSSLILRVMRSFPGDSLAISTVMSLGRSVTAMSSAYGSPLPLGSPSEVSSRRPHSPVFE
jgi:hypothetical protein